jgi:hypothetical protein
MRRLFRALAAILVVLSLAATPVAAASCKGNSHTPSLTNGGAAPATTTFGSPITFRVRYADTGGCVPSVVAVTVDGVGTFTMSTADTDLVAGVTYTWVTTLPVGSYGYSFSATSGQGGGQKTVGLTTVTPGRVVVNPPPPPPTPAPTPVPTPRPTPRPTAPPTPTPPPAPTPGGGQTGSTPVPAPAAPRSASGSPAPSSAATPRSTPSATEAPSPAATATETPTTPPSPGSTAAPVVGGVGEAGTGDPGTTGSPGPSPSPTDEGSPAIALGAVLAAALGGFALWLVAGRRRRDESPAGAQALAAGTMTTDTVADQPPTVTPLPPMRELVPPVNVVSFDEEGGRVEPRPDEVDMPRWLRPSLREARQGPTTYRRWDD